jgi:hypothetical protein
MLLIGLNSYINIVWVNIVVRVVTFFFLIIQSFWVRTFHFAYHLWFGNPSVLSLVIMGSPSRSYWGAWLSISLVPKFSPCTTHFQVSMPRTLYGLTQSTISTLHNNNSTPTNAINVLTEVLVFSCLNRLVSHKYTFIY